MGSGLRLYLNPQSPNLKSLVPMFESQAQSSTLAPPGSIKVRLEILAPLMFIEVELGTSVLELKSLTLPLEFVEVRIGTSKPCLIP